MMWPGTLFAMLYMLLGVAVQQPWRIKKILWRFSKNQYNISITHFLCIRIFSICQMD